MSESEGETTMEGSPFIKTRTLPQSDNMDSGTETSVDEDDDYQSAKKVDFKPAVLSAGLVEVRKNVKHSHPTYDKMLNEAMRELDEHKRSGIGISRIMKFIEVKYNVPHSKLKFFCKKAIEKGIRDETYVKTKGVGMNGSINFSSKHRRSEKNKLRKAQRANDEGVKKTAPKPKKVPAKKAVPKPKQSKAKKDSNNNSKALPKKAAVPKAKATISKTTGKARLSINVKAKPAVAAVKKSKTKAAKAAPPKKAANASKTKAVAGTSKAAASKTKAADSKTKAGPSKTKTAASKTKTAASKTKTAAKT